MVFYFALSFSTAAAEIEYLFSPVFSVRTCGPDPRFIIRITDKQKVDPKFWTLSTEADFISLAEWLDKEKKAEPIQVKMMAQELYETSDRALVQKIAETLKQKTEPK
jgi:hypothetical protein